MLTKIRNIFLVCIFGCAALVTATAQNAALPVQLCQQAGVKALTSGLPSTNYLQGVIPYCTVTVYLTGTTIVATTTPQTPLTASASGQFLIYATVNQGYDVVLSGGIVPNTYPSPVTITGVFPGQVIPGSCGTVPMGIPCGGTGATTFTPNQLLLTGPTSTSSLTNSGITQTGSGASQLDTFPGTVGLLASTTNSANIPPTQAATEGNVLAQTPFVNANNYLYLDTVHSGTDMAYAMNQAVGDQLLEYPSAITGATYCQPVWETVTVDRPSALDGMCLIPQTGGAGGTWGSAPVILSSVTLTLNTVVTGAPTSGSTTFSVPGGTCPSAWSTAWSANQAVAIGGVGLPPDDYVISCTSGTATLAIPAEYIVRGIPVASPAKVTYTATQVGLTTSNTLTQPGKSAMTISSLTPSTGTIALGSAPTTTGAIMTDFWVGGTLTTNLTYQGVAPVVSIVRNSSSMQNYERQNVGRELNHLTILDPGYTPLAGFGSGSVGRSLSGVQAVWIAGQDELHVADVWAQGIDGVGLMLAGPTAAGYTVRESNFDWFRCYFCGDPNTGQSSIVIATGSAGGDRTNQIGFTNVALWLNQGPSAVDVTNYSATDQPAGPWTDLVWFGGANNHIEDGGGDTPNSPLTPCADLLHLEYANSFFFTNGMLNGPDCGGSALTNVHGTSSMVSVTNSEILNAPGQFFSFTGSVTAGGTTITYVSGGWSESSDLGLPAASGGSHFDGRFFQVYGGGTGCTSAAPYNSYLANSSAQILTSGRVTGLNISGTIPASCTGNVTVLMLAGGTFYDLDAAPQKYWFMGNNNQFGDNYAQNPQNINAAAFGQEGNGVTAYGFTGGTLVTNGSLYGCHDLPNFINGIVGSNNILSSLNCQAIYGGNTINAPTAMVTSAIGYAGGTPVLNSSSCGTLGTPVGSKSNFYVASGSSGTCTIVTSSLSTAPHAWTCTATDKTTPTNVISQPPSSFQTTSGEVTGTTVSGDIIDVECSSK